MSPGPFDVIHALTKSWSTGAEGQEGAWAGKKIQEGKGKGKRKTSPSE